MQRKTRSGVRFGRKDDHTLSQPTSSQQPPSKDPSHAKIIEHDEESGKNIGYTLRTRPLDMNLKLEVKIAQEDDEDTGYFIHEDGLARQWKPPKGVVSGVVPTPIWKVVDSEKGSKQKWSRPSKYIRYKNNFDSVIRSPIIDYDITSDDEDFIDSLKEVYNDCNVTEDGFEVILDFFEKEYAIDKDSSVLPVNSVLERSKLSQCDICWTQVCIDSGSHKHVAKGMSCSNCGVVVHYKCYGKDTPTEWTCQKCLENGSSECRLCDSSKGYLIKEDDNWYHASCLVDMDCDAKHAEQLVQDYSTPCKLCKKASGYLQPCAQSGCKSQFHTRCAHIQGLYLQKLKGKSLYFCRRHSVSYAYPKSMKHMLLGVQLEVEELRKLRLLVSKNKKFPKINDEVLSLIFLYWLTKRHAAGRELIFRLYLLSEDTRRDEKQKMKLRKLEEKHEKAMHLRQHLERVRLLLDLCKKREQVKKQYLETLLEIVNMYQEEVPLYNNKKRSSSQINKSSKKIKRMLEGTDSDECFKFSISPAIKEVPQSKDVIHNSNGMMMVDDHSPEQSSCNVS